MAGVSPNHRGHPIDPVPQPNLRNLKKVGTGNIFPVGNQVDVRKVETEPEFSASINEYSKT